jgi:hypothetical protein
MPFGLFGIADDTLNLVVNLLVLFFVVVWFALIAWTYFDAKRRIDDPVLVMCATGASLFPYVGTIVYSILRPPEYLDDRHERELEIRAAELRLRQLEEQSCPNCQHPVERTYLRCPQCRARIKHPCEACREPVDPRWSLCPYCETALRPPQPERLPAAAQRRAAQSQRQAQPTHRQGPTRERPTRKSPASGGARGQAAASRSKQAPSRSATPAKPRQGGGRKPASGKGRPKQSGGDDGPRAASAS